MKTQFNEIPTWITVTLWLAIAIMLLGLFPAVHILSTSFMQEQVPLKSDAQLVYESYMYAMAVKQLAIIIIVGYSLFKKNAEYIYIVSLLLFLIYGFSSLYLISFGASLNLALSVVLCLGSGACLFSLRKMGTPKQAI